MQSQHEKLADAAALRLLSHERVPCLSCYSLWQYAASQETCCAGSGMHRRHAVHAVLCTMSAGKDSLLTWWAGQQDVLRFDVSVDNTLAVHQGQTTLQGQHCCRFVCGQLPHINQACPCNQKTYHAVEQAMPRIRHMNSRCLCSCLPR